MPEQSRYSADDVKIGVLVTVSAVLLLTLVAVTSDLGRYFRPKRTLRVLFRHVVGLKKNSPVNYSGVEVGRVKSVRVVRVDAALLRRVPPIGPELLFELPIADRAVLQALRGVGDPAEFDRACRRAIAGRDMVLLELEVDATGMSSVHQDDYVSVESTLMGDTTVEISPGSGPELPPGGILIGRSGSMFTRISDAVDEIRYLMRTAGIALSDARADLPAFFSKLHQAADNLLAGAADFRRSGRAVAGLIERTREDLVALAGKARSVAERTDGILQAVEGKAGPLVEDAASAARELRGSLEELRPRAARLTEAATSLSGRLEDLSRKLAAIASHALEALSEGRADLRRTTLNLKDASKNLEEFTALVKKKPWLLLRAPRRAGRDLEDVLSQARMLLDAATRLDEAATRLAASPAPPDAGTARSLAETARRLEALADALRRQARDIVEALRPLPLKEGGRGFAPEREPARYP